MAAAYKSFKTRILMLSHRNSFRMFSISPATELTEMILSPSATWCVGNPCNFRFHWSNKPPPSILAMTRLCPSLLIVRFDKIKIIGVCKRKFFEKSKQKYDFNVHRHSCLKNILNSMTILFLKI